MRIIAVLSLLIGIFVSPLIPGHGAETNTPAIKPRSSRSTNAPPKKKSEFDDTILQAMDHGTFYYGSVHGKTVALKGVAIKLADGAAGVSFDTELMRLADAWTGGYLEIIGERTTGGHPKIIGTNAVWTMVGPGWAKGDNFNDPRPVPVENKKGRPAGPLPREWAKYHGLYRHGDQVVLSYSVGDAEVLELPDFQEKNGISYFTRTFTMEKTRAPLTLLVCENAAAIGYVGDAKSTDGTNITGSVDGNLAVLNMPRSEGPATNCVAVAFVGKLPGARWEMVDKGRIHLKLPAQRQGTTFAVAIFSGPKSDLAQFAATARAGKLIDLKSLCQGGPARWGAPLNVAGKIGNTSGSYVVDTITVPEENPYKSWIRCSGLDFFSDGRAAVCSLSGDVWIVSGLDDKLDKVTWQRFATGLYQPLGLRIVKDQVYVTCRDQLIRLRDLNKDGEADFYECFNNDITITDHYHEFVLDLQTDSEGNFYFAKGGNLGQAELPHHGTLMRVSKDGRKLDVIATGLRAPNGLGMGPKNQLTVADNEGNWVPSSRVNLVEKGGFYGHVFTAHTEKAPTTFDPPLFWLPHSYEVDNSSGGQVWVTSDKWGPLRGHMLHTSYGACLLFHVMQEEVDGAAQAAAFKFPLSFDSGIMRGRFHPKDGQLYVCGLNVWQSASRSGANKRGIFQRVRYTGKPVQMPHEFHVRKNGLEITFTTALDAASASDPENYGIEQWNYKWTSAYGSPEFKASNPDEKGHDTLDLKSIKLSADKRKVFLEIAELKPVMQMKIKYNIKAADGSSLKQEIFNTINAVPGR